MLHSYYLEGNKVLESAGIKEQALWYDCVHLKEEEKHTITQKLKITLPNHKKIGGIKPPCRFYKKGSTLYLTASLVAHADSDPRLIPITFILNSHCFMTLREGEPKPFQAFKKLVLENNEEMTTPLAFFLNLLEIIVGRIAELTEKISIELDLISKEAFQAHKRSRSKILNEILNRLGKKEDLAAKINESLHSLERLLNFFNFQMSSSKTEQFYFEEAHVLQQDMAAATQHLTFLAHKINFLLDATLGYISIEQNSITKSFTIVAVVFLPPTLIAAIYGMNFHMPELGWTYGYPFALFLILLSAILPFLYFKKKGWL